tara:strand:+ start:324 stop:1031 length:708 start_codon:yes stop_codon:yes gene_type:complete
LNKKVAIITGASEGLGKAIAVKLASKKYITVLASRDKKKLEKTSNEIGKVNGQYLIIQTDVTSEKSVKKLFSKAAKLGQLELLINNAGVGTFNKVEEISFKDWKRMIDVNLTGSFLCSKEAILLMKKQKYGHILFINSLSGKRVLPWGSGYSASKYGLKGFADSIRLELRKSNVKVTSVFPGSIDTTWWDKMNMNFPRDKMLILDDVVDAIYNSISYKGRTVIEEIDLRQVGGDF